MPAMSTYTTPGVYIREKTAFPPTVVAVKTAVPGFVGYTEKAEVAGKPVLNTPIHIRSLAEFEQNFGKEFKPTYTITEVSANDTYDFRVQVPQPLPSPPLSPPPPAVLAAPDYRYYTLTDDGIAFNLYNSMRLFYANGGGECYVVSVGTYEVTAGSPPATTVATISPDALKAGLSAMSEQVGPTMLVVPDAVLLDPDDAGNPLVSAGFRAVTRAMLEQCELLQDRVAILDVYGTELLTPLADTGVALEDVVAAFHGDVGDKGLSYGMAYFPFLNTTVIPVTQFKYDNLNISDCNSDGDGVLQEILTWQTHDVYGYTSRADEVINDINRISPDNPPGEVKRINDNLTASLDLLKQILGIAVVKESILPPSAAMAGVMTYTDRTRGVWSAPANLSLSAVAQPNVSVNNATQGDLNVPVNGKAIDVLREFPGRGTVVWGARTLDGNSPDYRYVQVRRTLIYIEQSIKAALSQFVFAANNGQTWTTVVSTISGFLSTVWSQGGLMGATADEAFTVQCGLGSTMTGKDILDGYMLVQVTLQLLRPAEFIELTFKQTMEGVA